jgi:CRP-like cAMP-binding protein
VSAKRVAQQGFKTAMRDNIAIGRLSDRAATLRGFGASGVPTPCETCQVKEKNLCHLLLGGNTTSQPATQVHATAVRREVLLEAERAANNINVICDGWAFRFRRVRDGRRHILYFLLPGDVVYPLAGAPGFAIQALTDLRYCKFVDAEVKARLREDTVLFDAWVTDAVAERARLAATSVALGQFNASERIAQLVVQLRDRLEARGLVRDESCAFPLRQSHIADATGLTTVHVSRTLSTFRRDGVFSIEDGTLRISNPTKLRRIGEGGG